jgi:hypothetical protein
MKKEGFSLKKTLVILAIIAILIALGYFGKKSYCNPSGYLPEDIESVNYREIQEFFRSSDKEILCTGMDEQFNKIFSGKTSYIACRIKQPETGKYSIEITKANALKRTSAEIDAWIESRKWEGTSEIAIFPIEIPQGVDGESLRIEIVIRKDSQLIFTENLNFDIYMPQDWMNKIC